MSRVRVAGQLRSEHLPRIAQLVVSEYDGKPETTARSLAAAIMCHPYVVKIKPRKGKFLAEDISMLVMYAIKAHLAQESAKPAVQPAGG